jgi:hypothetical protein
MSTKPFLNMDERSKGIAGKIIAVMYFLTIISMQGVSIYRQLILKQSIYDFQDFAIILTINSLFLITALLYFGAIPFQKIKVKVILGFYGLIVVLGSLFTYAKYNIFLGQNLSILALFDKLIIIFAVSGLIVLFFTLFSFLGKRKMDKELKE